MRSRSASRSTRSPVSPMPSGSFSRVPMRWRRARSTYSPVVTVNDAVQVMRRARSTFLAGFVATVTASCASTPTPARPADAGQLGERRRRVLRRPNDQWNPDTRTDHVVADHARLGALGASVLEGRRQFVGNQLDHDIYMPIVAAVIRWSAVTLGREGECKCP